MRATTLLLPDDLRQRLREAAVREGISVGEFVRRTLRVVLESPPGGSDRRPGRRRPRVLPRSVDEYLSAPAGTYFGLAREGDASEPEDAYADVD
jgi:hypothetical protein